MERAREEVLGYLRLMGLKVLKRDEPLLDFCLGRVEERILNACNLREVPEGLTFCFAGMALAEYLAARRSCGGLEGSALALEPLVKQLQEGDTSVTWDTGSAVSPDQLLDRLIEGLRGLEGQLVRYRKVAW